MLETKKNKGMHEVLVLTSVVASYLPARRAASISPSVALRSD